MKFDKFLGRIRENDSDLESGSGLTVLDVQNLIANSFIDFNQLVGDPSTNTTLKTYIDNLLANIDANTFHVGDEITQEMLDYFQSIISQLTIIFDQITGDPSINSDFQTYIDNLVQDLTDYFATLVLGGTLTQEIQDYIDARLSEITTVLEQLIQNTINNDLRQYIDQIINEYNGLSDQTRLIFGSVVWIENLDFQVSPLVYQILGQRVETAEKLLTIPANAVANPRFAVIYGDIFGNIGYILGDAAANPAIPLVDPATQILITPVYIPSLGTAPGTDPNGETGEIITEVIYDENIEWPTAKTEEAGVAIDLESVIDPAVGVKHIRIAFTGGASTAERSELIQGKTPRFQDFYLEVAAPSASDLVVPMSGLFPDHKTDTLIDTIRHLVFYRIPKKLVGFALNVYTNVSYKFTIDSYTTENFAVAGIGFTAEVPANITFKHAGIPAGVYILTIGGFTRYDQQYIISPDSFIIPAAALASFTRATAINAKGGKISLSIQPSADWFDTTGLLFELYNGASKVGQTIVFTENPYGFNPAILDYQRISIPVSAFNPSADVIDKMVIRPLNAWPNDSSLDIDNIILQTGINTPAGEEIDDITFEYKDAENGNVYTLDPAASFGYKVKELVIKTDAGTATVNVKINGTSVTGVSAVAVTDTRQTVKASAANSTVNDDVVTLTIDALAGATNLIGKIRRTK